MEVMYQISKADLNVLVERVVAKLQKSPSMQQKWLTPKEAMLRLNLKSKTTLYYLRIRGEITYTQPRKRVILYSAASIDDYLARNVKKSF
jgi:hypothetical protein